MVGWVELLTVVVDDVLDVVVEVEVGVGAGVEVLDVEEDVVALRLEATSVLVSMITALGVLLAPCELLASATDAT